jgi:hypothetical protein
MPLCTSLIALALLGADGAGPPPTHVITEFRLLEMDGLKWREPVHARLQFVTQRDGATVWTTSRETAAEIVKMADKVTAAPKVAHALGASAFITAGTTRHYVAQLGRIADGPCNKATSVAFDPKIQALQDGCQIQVVGQALDQGVLLRVDLTDTRFVAFHTAACAEEVQPRKPGQESTRIEAKYQVPEVACTHVKGEWLVPDATVLVVSMGVHSVEGTEGNKVVRERLALIEAKGTPAAPAHPSSPLPPGAVNLSGTLALPPAVVFGRRYVDFPVRVDESAGRVVYFVVPTPAPALIPHPAPISVSGLNLPAADGRPAAHRAMPRVPSRVLPQGVAPDGSTVPLPPLPEDEEAEAADFEEESAEPRPSPQVKPRPAPKPAQVDPTHARLAWPEIEKSAPLIARIPIGPFTGEVRIQPGTPSRLMVGLKLGSMSLSPALDEAVTKASTITTEPRSKPKTATTSNSDTECCAAAGDKCREKDQPKALDIDVSLSPSEILQTYLGLAGSSSPKSKETRTGQGRPVRIEWPIGDGTIEIEIRAHKTR